MFRHKARLMLGGNVVNSTEQTKYSSTIKDMSAGLMTFLYVKNGLGLMDGDIVNEFCMSPCDKNIWSCCGADFGTRCDAVVFLKGDLYGLKTASNSFQNYFGDFIRDLGFPPSRADQYLWIHKYDKCEGYEYIATHVDDVIIAAKNPSKYMHGIEMHFEVREITDSPN